jgi:hypothetical protein
MPGTVLSIFARSRIGHSIRSNMVTILIVLALLMLLGPFRPGRTVATGDMARAVGWLWFQ